ncbi:hypothetical protein E2562_003264 [Oryza meyeriana var. granulata]|uniref:NAC domain-containing protein n=1 Tax=Oryza meyeriana var. granulata TaxID=110450 RepID=A0A6G1EEL3_9ORYZ|nr:hypothetical protein E2562_003264 [Oryza meyeriana var. granulata]
MQSNGGEGSAAPASNGRKHELVPQLMLPPGLHFAPTDEELVDFYLRSKIEGQRPPLDFINEVDIMSWDPVKLIEKYKGYGENRWYFFTRRKPSKSKKQDEPNRKVVVDGLEEGSWSATGSVIHIRRKAGIDQKTIIGTKRVLTYKSIRSVEDDKWSMHEYILKNKSQMDQYVLCAIQLKQTYEAEKKAREEGKSGNDRKRKTTRKGKRDAQTISQVQEEQHETSTLGETTGHPYEFFDPSSVEMMFQGEEDALMPSFSQGNDDMQADNDSIAFEGALDQRHNTNLTRENADISGNILLDGNIVI